MANIVIGLEKAGKGISISLNDKFGTELYNWAAYPNFSVLKSIVNSVSHDANYLALDTTLGYMVFDATDIDTIAGVAPVDLADAVDKLKELIYSNLMLGDATLNEQLAQTASLERISDASKFEFDAARALRTSEPTILFNGLAHNNEHLDLYDTVKINGGTSTYVKAKSGVDMAVFAAGDAVVCKSLRHMPYFAGKTQEPEFTMTNMGVQAGVIKMFGYCQTSTTPPHDAALDGFYFMADGGADMTHKIACYNAGVLQFEKKRNEWDDPLDGTGASGIDIDFDNFTIQKEPFLWLGGSNIDFKLQYGKEIITFHSYPHSALNKAGVMMQSPFQPTFFAIRSIGGAGSMTRICSTVSTSAKVDGKGEKRSIDTGNTRIACGSPSNQYLICAVRLKVGEPNADATILSIVGSEVNSREARFRVLIDPVISGAALSWNDVDPSSSIEFAIGDTGGGNLVTGGRQTDVSFQERRSASSADTNSLTRLGTRIDGTPIIVALAAAPIDTTNAEIFGGMNMLENN